MSSFRRSRRAKNLTRIAVSLLVVAVAADTVIAVRALALHQNPTLLQSILATTSTLVTLGAFSWRQLAPTPRDLESINKMVAELARAQRRVIKYTRHAALLSKRARYIDLKLQMVNPCGKVLAKRLSHSSQIGQLIQEMPSRRLVVIGGPGSGKSVLALDIANHIATPEASDPARVPVILPVQEWNIGYTNVNFWLATQLVSILGIERGLAWELLEEGRIFPIFDGLDEMDPASSFSERGADLLEALDELESPFVITMRKETWDKLKNRAKVLDDVAAVEVMPAGSAQITEHLEACNPKHSNISRIREDLIAHPHGFLSEVLATPFDLVLAGNLLRVPGGAKRLENYLDRPPKDETRRELDGELMQSFFASRVAWNTRASVDATRAERHPYRIGRYYSEPNVTRWCRSIARFLSSPDFPQGTSGLTLEQMWRIGGRKLPCIVDGLLTLLLWMPLVVTLFNYLDRQSVAVRYAATIIAIMLPLASIWANRGPVHPSRIYFSRLTTRTGIRRMGTGFLLGTGVFFLGLSVLGPLKASAYCIGFSLVVGLGLATNVRKSMSIWIFSVIALLIGLVLEYAIAAVANGADFPVTLGTGMVAGGLTMVIGVQAGIRFMKLLNLGRPDSWLPGPPTPLSSLTENIAASGIAFVLAAASTLYVGLSSSMLAMSPPMTCFLAIFAGVAVGPGYVGGVWRRHLALVLVARRSMPFRLASFLRWAHDVGILRTSGRSYEFRHKRIEQWLLIE